MKDFMLILLTCALVVPAFGVEIIVGPYGDGTADDGYSSSNYGIGVDYIAPADCSIERIEILFHTTAIIGDAFDAEIWSSDGASPPFPVAELGSVAATVTNNDATTWDEIDLSGLGLTLNDGDEFFAIMYVDPFGPRYISYDNDSGTYHAYIWGSGSDPASEWPWSTSSRNMNIRVVVDDGTSGIETTSLGSIKATFK